MFIGLIKELNGLFGEVDDMHRLPRDCGSTLSGPDVCATALQHEEEQSLFALQVDSYAQLPSIKAPLANLHLPIVTPSPPVPQSNEFGLSFTLLGSLFVIEHP